MASTTTKPAPSLGKNFFVTPDPDLPTGWLVEDYRGRVRRPVVHRARVVRVGGRYRLTNTDNGHVHWLSVTPEGITCDCGSALCWHRLTVAAIDAALTRPAEPARGIPYAPSEWDGYA